MLYVPDDIVSLIIDELRDDKASLTNCSLVCRSFLPSCRTHLFATVSLFHEGDESIQQLQRYRDFHTIVSITPQIASHVRHLLLCDRLGGSASIWLEEDLPRTLLLLSHLQSFTLVNALAWLDSPKPMFMTDWAALLPPLQLALSTMFKLPTLTDISLTLVDNLPLEMFRHCPNIDELSLSFIQSSETLDVGVLSLGVEAAQPKGYLRTLTTSIATGFRPLFNELIHPRSLLSIGRLEIFKVLMYEDDDVELGWKVIKIASDSLQYLSWDAAHIGVALQPPEAVDINICPNLQYFSYSSQHYDLRGVAERFQAMLLFIKKLSAAAHGVKSGNIVLRFFMMGRLVSNLHRYVVWAALDALLADFASLEYVEVHIEITPTRKSIDFDAIEAQFHAATMKGIRVIVQYRYI